MKKARQKALADAYAKLNEVFTTVGEILAEEEDAYDNLSESAQDGERGEELQDRIDNLQEASDNLEEAMDILGDMI